VITCPDILDIHFCKFQLHTKHRSPTETSAVPLTVAHEKETILGQTNGLSLTVVSNKCLRKEQDKQQIFCLCTLRGGLRLSYYRK